MLDILSVHCSMLEEAGYRVDELMETVHGYKKGIDKLKGYMPPALQHEIGDPIPALPAAKPKGKKKKKGKK